MQIELWPITRVKPYANNPRVNDGAVDYVAASLREFGWRQPIVVDQEGVVIVGHTRIKAAETLGLTEVPVHVATELSPDQIKAYRIADNQTASIAEWDKQLLPIEIGDLKAVGYDLGLLGFEPDELQKWLGTDVAEGQCDADEVPAPPDQAVTKPGDLWILGNHRLLCGDSSKPDDVDRLLDGNPIHLVHSDPPYNVDVEPASRGADTGPHAGKRPKRPAPSWRSAENQQAQGIRSKPKGTAQPTKTAAKGRRIAGDCLSEDEFAVKLRAWFGNMSRVLQPGRGFYLWGGYANLTNYPTALSDSGLYMSQCLIWDKQHPVITRKDYMGAFEMCQPPDTNVLTASGTSRLGAMCDGDRVVSFHPHTSAVVGLRNGLNIRVAKREYTGELYGVSVGNRQTWCTDRHIWTVRLLGARQPVQVQACHLSPSIMEVPISQGGQKVRWQGIRHIDVQPYSGTVCSLGVDTHEHYIADGIVTHNCYYGWKEGAAHTFLGPNNVTDLWHVKKVSPQKMVHLTEKPVELAVRAMQYSSRPGENVLDLFGGSGSTLIGAEQTGRNAYLMELDVLYCDTICDRYQRFSGKPAVLERTGESPIPMKPREEAMR